MIEITSGYELTTSITNIFILIFSIFGYVEIKDKRWNFFFLCMILDSFIGTIVHGIVMSEQVYNLLWVFLAICFTLVFCCSISLDMFRDTSSVSTNPFTKAK